MDVIKLVQTEWVAPIMLALKQNGTLRLGAYYCKLNAVTIGVSYRILHVDECIASLRDTTNFSTLDASSGYWQLEVGDEDHYKTAFTSLEGLFPYIWMPFSLKAHLGCFNAGWTSYYSQ